MTPRKSSLSTTSILLRIHFFRRLRRQRVSLFVYETKDISSYNRITPLLQYFFLYFPLFTRIAHSYMIENPATRTYVPKKLIQKVFMFFATAAVPCSASAALRYVFFVFNIIILLYTEKFM